MDTDYAKYYERLYYEHWWWQARSRFVSEWLDDLQLPTQGCVLDIGCGGGWAFPVWQKYGDVYGIEISQDLVDSAGGNKSQIHCGSFDDRYYPEKPLTLILMLDVLEHMRDPLLAIQHAFEILEPGGHILMTVPAMPSLWTSHDELNHHYMRYTKTSFESMIRSTSFEVRRLKYFFLWTTVVKLLIRVKEALIRTSPSNPHIPGPIFNRLFYHASLWEHRLLRNVNMPLGTSLVCVAVKPR